MRQHARWDRLGFLSLVGGLILATLIYPGHAQRGGEGPPQRGAAGVVVPSTARPGDCLGVAAAYVVTKIVCPQPIVLP